MTLDGNKKFGKHVAVFSGKKNGGRLTSYVSFSFEPLDNGYLGEWLTIKDAERHANNLLKAVAFIKEKRGIRR